MTAAAAVVEHDTVATIYRRWSGKAELVITAVQLGAAALPPAIRSTPHSSSTSLTPC
jgi:hypothetical protein